MLNSNYISRTSSNVNSVLQDAERTLDASEPVDKYRTFKQLGPSGVILEKLVSLTLLYQLLIT